MQNKMVSFTLTFPQYSKINTAEQVDRMHYIAKREIIIIDKKPACYPLPKSSLSSPAWFQFLRSTGKT
jgi:hypothetical protein